MAVTNQEDQEAPSLPLQSLSHLQEPMGCCVVPVPNHSPAKRKDLGEPCPHPHHPEVGASKSQPKADSRHLRA